MALSRRPSLLNEKPVKTKSSLKQKMMFWKTLDLFWCQHYVRFESILHVFDVIVAKRPGLNGVQLFLLGHGKPVPHPSSQAETAVYCYPPVQGSSESQSLNSLDGSKIKPLCPAASGTCFPTPSSLPPLLGCFCNALSLFCKIPLIVMKWVLQPPFGNKWSLNCVLSILNLSLRCFCC